MRRLKEVNIAMLGKWSWSFAMGGEKLWLRSIKEKYGSSHNGWFTNDVSSSHGCGLWKGVMSQKALFENNFKFALGDGKWVRFWEDTWVGNKKTNGGLSLTLQASYKQNGVCKGSHVQSK